MTEITETMLRRWLLHQLPVDQARQLEQRLLQDDELGAYLRAVETDLLDDYARDRLTVADRMAVASHLLATPRDRERLRFAAALAQHDAPLMATARTPDANRRVAHARPPRWSSRRRLAVTWGGLAAACAVLVAVVGLNLHNGEAPSSAKQAVMTITLAEPRRGANVAEIRIPHGIDKIRLQAEVGSAAPQTRYTLTVSDGAHTVFSAKNLLPREAPPYRYVQVMIAAQTLGNGEHRVKVAPEGTTGAATAWSIRTRTESAGSGG